MRNYFFIYTKDKHNKRTGHTICILMGLDKAGQSRAYYGMSLCSEQDQFSYKVGRELALQRALEAEAKKLS